MEPAGANREVVVLYVAGFTHFIKTSGKCVNMRKNKATILCLLQNIISQALDLNLLKKIFFKDFFT